VPTWPATLPQTQFVQLSDARQMAVAEFVPDSGPPKRRRRYSARRLISIQMILDNAARKTFDAFWRDTLLEGSLEFDWTDPVTDGAATLQFTGAPPVWQLLSGGDDQQRSWGVTFAMVLL
jgi:hypothetical protein